MNNSQGNILIIDNDIDLCSFLEEYLSKEDFIIDFSNAGSEGLEKAIKNYYDLIILDIVLPDRITGFDILRELRTVKNTPVIILTARIDDVDRIVGLELGADDYMPKPFNVRELIARIRAILRRSQNHIEMYGSRIEPKKYCFGDIELDMNSHMAFRNKESIRLTETEFSILAVLLQNFGQIVSRDDLAKEVLGRPLFNRDRSIDVHVSKLRKKLFEESDSYERIIAVRGKGYSYIFPTPDSPVNTVSER